MSLDIAKSVTKNMAVMTGTQVITYISSFILMIFLPRYLGPEDYGRLYLGISITGIFTIFIEFGCRYSIAKAVSRDRENAAAIVINSIGIRLFFWVASFLILMTVAHFVRYPNEVKIIILILGVGMLLSGLREVLRSFFQGFEKMQYPSYAGIIDRVFMTTTGVTALLLGANAVVIAALMVAAELLYFFVSARFAKRLLPVLPKIDWKASLAMVRDGVPYFLQSVFGFIYYRIDTVMLSLMTPASTLGWYGASYKFFDTLMFVPNIYSIAVFPVLSRLWKKENFTMSRIMQKSLQYILMIGIPISVVTFMFARQIIQSLYGLSSYEPSVVLLQIFAVGLILLYIDWVLCAVLLASDKQRQISINAFAAIFLNIGLNYVMIPYAQVNLGNGGVGSAIATLLTEFFIMVAMLFAMPKDISSHVNVSVYLKGVAAGFTMIGSIMLMRAISAHWMAQVILSPFVYLGSLLWMKTFEPSEIAFAKSMMTIRNLKHTFIPDKGVSV